MVDFISVTSKRYAEFQQDTANELSDLHSIIKKGWPDKNGNSTHCQRILDNQRHVVMASYTKVPSMRKDMLKIISATHMGITQCKQRAREAMYWPCQ